MSTTRCDLRPKAIELRATGIFRLAIGFLADKYSRLLVDAITECELTRNTVKLCINTGDNAVLRLVRHREIINREINVGVSTWRNPRRQQCRDFVRVCPVRNLQHRPIDYISWVSLRRT